MSSIPDGRPDLLLIFGHDGPVNLQQSDLRLFQRFKNLHEDCEAIWSTLEACRIRGTKDDGSKEDAGDSAAFFRAFSGEYFEFDGIPFAGSCRAPIHPSRDWSDRKCEFRYQMMEGLSVSYRVDDRRVPEEDFIAFDRALRAEILNARRPELDAAPAKAGN